MNNQNATEKNNTADGVSEVEYTREQKIVAAVWMHERKYNFQTYDDIRKNFQIRFQLPAPDPKEINNWEKQLFSVGEIDNNTSKEGLGGILGIDDEFSDVGFSDEESD
ncbi:unnamed protein product [Phyllotreta striolata]|uniref:Uncharacterized protein n=1 Tax=Phyllotreta striolata TaxID=444603 RepID=A0A9N9TQJ0_PHYSR|nr:unnamed protein product [Phyllotreta striolata]